MKIRLLLLMGLVFLGTACNIYEPVKFGPLTLQLDTVVYSSDKSQPICNALENAGYIMPYGTPFGGFQFKVMQLIYGMDSPRGSSFKLPITNPYLYILVDWGISADVNQFPDGVTQETVDLLGVEAKKICHIAQTEAQKQGIANLRVHISLRDLFVGTQIEYDQPEGTTDCDQIKGYYTGKSVGLNPQGRTPNLCPSLYVPN